MKLNILLSTLAVAVLIAVTPVNNITAETAPPSLRIIEGTRAPASSFPNVTPVIFNGKTICTATLISSSMVLTAAHCLFSEQNQRVVRDNDLQFILGGQVLASSKIYIHPSYSSRSVACVESEYDSALIQIATPELIPSNINPAVLARSIPFRGQALTLVGYGYGGQGASGEINTQPPSGYLNYGSSVIEKASQSYIQWVFDPGESNTASGDSGGPSFTDISGLQTLTGITCGGTGDAQYGTDSFNTRIDKIVSWIDSIAGTAPSPSAPQFIGPQILQAEVGKEFSAELSFSGSPADRIDLSGLPPGLSLNGNILSGVPQQSGQFVITVSASNSFGSSSSEFSLSVTSFSPRLNLSSALLQFDRISDSSDFLIIRGKILLPDKFKPRKKLTKIQIGRFKKSCKLDISGGCGEYNYFQIKGKLTRAAFTKSYLAFTIQIIDTKLFKALATLGFPETPYATAGEVVQMPLELVLDGILYSATSNLKFRASDERWVISE